MRVYTNEELVKSEGKSPSIEEVRGRRLYS